MVDYQASDFFEHRFKLLEGCLSQYRENGMACILVPPGGIGEPDVIEEVARQVLETAAALGGYQAPVVRKLFLHDVVAWAGYLRESFPVTK